MKKLLLLILLFSSKNCWWKVKIPQVNGCYVQGFLFFTKVDSFILPPTLFHLSKFYYLHISCAYEICLLEARENIYS